MLRNAKEDERAQKQQEELERQAEAIALKNSKIYPKPPSSIAGSNQSNSKPAVQEQFVALPVPAVSAVPMSGNVLLSPKVSILTNEHHSRISFFSKR